MYCGHAIFFINICIYVASRGDRSRCCSVFVDRSSVVDRYVISRVGRFGDLQVDHILPVIAATDLAAICLQASALVFCMPASSRPLLTVLIVAVDR